MNIQAIATLLIRLTAFSFCFDGVILLTYLPGYLFALGHGTYQAALRELEAAMVIVRALLYWGVAFAMLRYSKPLARLFTRGITAVPEESKPPGVWPPAPQTPGE